EKFWRSLTNALEMPQLEADVRFATREARTKNYKLLQSELQAIFVRRPRAEWLERLVAHDVPHAKIALLEEVVQDPHVVSKNIFSRRQHAREGEIVSIKRPVLYDGSREGIDLPPPALGEHSTEVLAALGFDSKAIARMTAASKED